MKLAVIGSGVLALETAVHFHQLGANVKLFTNSSHWGGKLNSNSQYLSKVNYEVNMLPTLTGRQFLELNSDFTSLKDYLDYLQGLGDKLESLGIVKRGKVLRVHKRFLNPSQSVEGKSRLIDLFRVIFRIDARKDIELQKEQNKELFEKLGEEVVSSLQDSIESYEDFDLVVDATGPFGESVPMGASNSYALNEKVISKDECVGYTSDILSKLEMVTDKTPVVTFIGDGVYNLNALGTIKDLFSKSNLKIQIVTQGSIPFSTTDEKLYASWLESFQELLALDTKEYKEAIEIFEKKIIEWKSLESHIRAKIPRPAEPISRIFVYNGAVVSSVDKLFDQKGLFLTIEGSSLLGSEDVLKTLSSNYIFVDNGRAQANDFSCYLDNDDEPGFFKLNTVNAYSLVESDLSQIKTIESEIMKYFSKA